VAPSLPDESYHRGWNPSSKFMQRTIAGYSCSYDEDETASLIEILSAFELAVVEKY